MIDAFTRECLALETDTSMPSRRVTRILQTVIATRGIPMVLRSDNGSEITSRHYLAWCRERGIGTRHIQPGRPMQNGHAESFHGLRDECLNVNWFWNLWDARRKISNWRLQYNRHRPHSALRYQTPEEFACHGRSSDLLSPMSYNLMAGSGGPCQPGTEFTSSASGTLDWMVGDATR